VRDGQLGWSNRVGCEGMCYRREVIEVSGGGGMGREEIEHDEGGRGSERKRGGSLRGGEK